MRTEEYEIKRLCNDTKQVMRDICQSSSVAISGLLAERLYEMGWRQQDRMLNGEENEILTTAVDATFRGAVLRFAEKLKQRSYCDNCFKDGKWHRYVFVEDIDDTAQKFLESET